MIEYFYIYKKQCDYKAFELKLAGQGSFCCFKQVNDPG